MRVLLFGHHIAYAASPAMMRAAFAAAGLDGWTYELCDVAPTELADAVGRLREEAYAGANVTIPHKVAIIDLLDAVEGEAAEVGAVNAIRKQDGRLVGDNTDVVGLRQAMAAAAIPQPRSAVVLGIGGSARAAAAALRGADVTYVARRPEAAGPLQPVLDWWDPTWHRLARSADVVVNATPVGRHGENPLPEGVTPGGAVVDLVYVEGGTPLVRQARQRGRPAVDGWAILVGQGAAAFTSWTGLPAPVTAMRAALPA